MNRDISKQHVEFNQNTSYHLHKKQRFWQILFPVGLGVLLILILVVLVILTSVHGDAQGEVSIWADASMIWLILPVLIFAVVMTVILLGLIFLLAKVLHILPSYTSQAQYYVELFSSKVKYLAGKLTEPIIKVRNIGATITAIVSALSGRSRQC